MDRTYDVYLAGAMTGRKISEVLKERYKAHGLLRKAGLTFYCPAADEELEGYKPSHIISTAYDKRKMDWFVKKDLAAVAASRSVLNLNGDRISDGAAWEMAFAVYHRQIPVYIVAPERSIGLKMGFTNILVDGIFTTQEEAIKALAKELQRRS
jgi:nucleoside 2-deoxyribosyltransferase